MKKILIGYFMDPTHSGIGRYILNFYRNIDKNKYHVDFLTRCDVKPLQKYVDEDSKIFKVSRTKRIFTQFFEMRKIIKENNYDTIYFNISESYNCVGVVLSKMLGVRNVIVHSHSSGSEKTGIKKILTVFLNKIFKGVLETNVDKKLACSMNAAKWLYKKSTIKSGDYEIVYSKIDDKKFKFDEEIRKKIRKKLKINNDIFLLGTVGRNTAIKNQKFLIKILSKMNKKYKLLIVGDGDLHNELIKYAKDLNLSDRVIFTGDVENPEDYYQAMDAFLLPSLFEGLPLCAIEAQFAGLPSLISSNVTRETTITNDIKYLDVDSEDLWIDEISKIEKGKRNSLNKNAETFMISKKNKKIDSIINDFKTRRIEKLNFEFVFSLLFVIEGFLQACNYTVGTKIISLILWPMTFLGIIILLYRFIMYKNYKLGFRNVLLLIFDCTLLIPAFIFKKYNLYLNIKFFLLMLFQFGILYSYPNRSDEKKRQNLNMLSNAFIFVTALLTLCSFYVLLTNYNYVINTSGDPIVYAVSAGRLYGVFCDPNIGALIATISIIMSLHKIITSKRIFIKLVNILLCFLFSIYISLSDSRMAILCLIVGIIFYLILLLVSCRKMTNFLKIGLLIFASVLIVLTLQSKKTYNQVISKVNKSKIISTTSSNKKSNSDITKNKIEYIQIEREYDLNKDITNRRIDIWKSGLEIVRKEPVFGIGHANVLSYVKEELPNTYIINNTQKNFSSMHNMLMDTVVSQGLTGLIIYLTFIILTGFIIIKNLRYLINLNLDNIMFITIVFIEFIASMVITEIIYIDSPMSVIFWICLGQLVNYADFKKKKVQNEE